MARESTESLGDLTEYDSIEELAQSVASPSNHKGNVNFHSLQQVDRDVAPASLTIGRINRNGLNKNDIKMSQEQVRVQEVYHDDAITKHGLSVRPFAGEWSTNAQNASMFDQPRQLGRLPNCTKGLANFSSIKVGDDRIQRVNSNAREEFRNPVDREAYGRPVMDPHFKNIQSTGHAGVGLFTKSFQMASEVKGDESHNVGLASTSRHPASATVAPGGAQGGADLDTAKRLRSSLYRQAVTNLGCYDPATGRGDLATLGDLEKIFRYKLSLKSCKGVGQFTLPTMFTYLDRSGRGGFDLEDFRQVNETMVLDFNEDQTISLFAKFDRGFKGFVSYSDFSTLLGYDPELGDAEVGALLTKHAHTTLRNQHKHQLWSADMKLQKSRVLKQILAAEDPADEATIGTANFNFQLWFEEQAL